MLAFASSGCSTWLGGQQNSAQWHVQMPPDAAAAIVSAALITELHAEPIARASGAPVVREAQDRFVVELTSNARGQWLPQADHRLVLRSCCDKILVEQIELADRELPGFAARSSRQVRVEIAAAGRGSTVRLFAGAADYARLCPVVERTLLLASSTEGSGPGLAEANLAAWRLSHLLQEANATIDGNRRGNLLRRAARQPTAPSSLFRELAHLAASNGQLDEAGIYLRRGLLAEPDIHVRAQLAVLADDFVQRTKGPTDLRNRALGMMVAGDLAGAEKMLHSARRTDARPAVDYQLLAHVHRYRGDEMAALAAQLLAREYDAQARSQDDAAAIAQNRGISNLAGRLSRDVRVATKQITPQALPATPPR